MSKINYGGPAFPEPGLCDGMSMRDYFAAAALTGLMANLENVISAEEAATIVYHIANAMIAARDPLPKHEYNPERAKHG